MVGVQGFSDFMCYLLHTRTEMVLILISEEVWCIFLSNMSDPMLVDIARVKIRDWMNFALRYEWAKHARVVLILNFSNLDEKVCFFRPSTVLKILV